MRPMNNEASSSPTINGLSDEESEPTAGVGRNDSIVINEDRRNDSSSATFGIEDLKETNPELIGKINSKGEISTPTEEEQKEVDLMDIDESSAGNQDTNQIESESQKDTTSTTNNNSNIIANSGTGSASAYSTRGRSTENTLLSSVTATSVETTQQEQSTNWREATLEESPRPKESSASVVSFLVQSMTEEERRTRTRFLPSVDGMHDLQKNEVKDDVALARSLPTIISSLGSIQTRTERIDGNSAAKTGASNSSSGRKSNTADNSMDVDSDEIGFSLIGVIDWTKTIKLPDCYLIIPSDSFVAPKVVVLDERDVKIVVKEIAQSENNAPPPSSVHYVTAFNPPRPPESVGGKKRHRMLRWERRPEDIEVDMKNYRRTVQRTSQELQKSEDEYERLEMIDAHLRRHFLNHTDLLKIEYGQLCDAIDDEIDALMKESDVAGSRTRSKNLTKVEIVMRDVLTMLTRNNEPKDAPTDAISNRTQKEFSDTIFLGYGGLHGQAFEDWDSSTTLKRLNPSCSWIKSGMKVKTQYGNGTVLAVIPPQLPSSSPTINMKNVHSSDGKNSGKNSASNHASESMQDHHTGYSTNEKFGSLLPLRFKIRFQYGIATVRADAITSVESAASFTDGRLAKRWKGIIQSVVNAGPCIDTQGILPDMQNSNDISQDMPKVSSLDVNRHGKVSDEVPSISTESFLPPGAFLVPTKNGRGNLLHIMEVGDIENMFQSCLYDGKGILGRKSNPGVTEKVKKWEEDEHESMNLRANVLQLNNVLYRQRRIRILNERTSNSMKDRYERAEELVSEMRSDLKSLKQRLEDELEELGVTDELSNQIIFQFYQGNHEGEKGDATTPKRSRRASSMIGEILSGNGIGKSRNESDLCYNDDTDDGM